VYLSVTASASADCHNIQTAVYTWKSPTKVSNFSGAFPSIYNLFYSGRDLDVSRPLYFGYNLVDRLLLPGSSNGAF